jgi:serine/threonine-protein kinase RsbW
LAGHPERNRRVAMAEKPPPKCEFNKEKLILHLDLTIPGEVEAIGPVVEKVMWVVGQMGCSQGRDFEIETALREALANAVVHGCKKDSEKEVRFLVACDEAKGMMIVVRDPGQGFDPDQIPSPIVGECLFSEHGRGIYLINELMDEVRFKKGGTEIHMLKN